MPIAPDRETAHVQLDEPPARDLQRARVTGDDREAEPRFDGVLDRAVRAELHRDAQFRPLLARRLFQRPPAAGRRLAHDERLSLEILQAQAPLVRERVSRGRHQDELVAQERDDRELWIFQRGPDDRQVELVAQYLFLHTRPRPDLERDDQPRMQLLESAERSGQDVNPDGGARSNPQRSTLDAAHLLDRHGRLVQHVEHPPGVAVQQRPRFGQLDALAEPVEQRQAERFLQLLDLVRDRRLAELEAPRREAEAGQVGDRFERPQLPQSHRSVEIELGWGPRHGAYDMRYGRPETSFTFARSSDHSESRRRRSSPTRGDDGLRAEDQPVPQAPLPGAAR